MESEHLNLQHTVEKQLETISSLDITVEHLDELKTMFLKISESKDEAALNSLTPDFIAKLKNDLYNKTLDSTKLYLQILDNFNTYTRKFSKFLR